MCVCVFLSVSLFFIEAQFSFSGVGSQFRHDGPIQSFSVGEAGGSNPAIHGYAHTSNQSYFTPHLALSSPSRLGQQQPVQRHNMGRSAQYHDGESRW